MHDLTRQVPLPEVRFITLGQALCELEGAPEVVLRDRECECEDPDQQPGHILRWVKRQRQRVVDIDVSVHVSDAKVGLVNCCLQCQFEFPMHRWYGLGLNYSPSYTTSPVRCAEIQSQSRGTPRPGPVGTSRQPFGSTDSNRSIHFGSP